MSVMFEVMSLDYVMRTWKKSPHLPKRAYGNNSWRNEDPSNDLPLSGEEVVEKKARLRLISPATFARLFPEEIESAIALRNTPKPPLTLLIHVDGEPIGKILLEHEQDPLIDPQVHRVIQRFPSDKPLMPFMDPFDFERTLVLAIDTPITIPHLGEVIIQRLESHLAARSNGMESIDVRSPVNENNSMIDGSASSQLLDGTDLFLEVDPSDRPGTVEQSHEDISDLIHRAHSGDYSALQEIRNPIVQRALAAPGSIISLLPAAMSNPMLEAAINAPATSGEMRSILRNMLNGRIERVLEVPHVSHDGKCLRVFLRSKSRLETLEATTPGSAEEFATIAATHPDEIIRKAAKTAKPFDSSDRLSDPAIRHIRLWR